MSFSTIVGIIVITTILILIFQITKIIEYVNTLKGEEEARKSSNKVNAILMIIFLVGGLLSIYLFNENAKHKILTISSSIEGETYDVLLWTTMTITAIVFFITQIFLFVFAYKYRYNVKRNPVYFSHSTKLEIVWTTIPAVTMFILVASGLVYWFRVTGDAPKDSMSVEVVGKQFEWIIRYPGKDGILGKRFFRNINDANNRLGLLWDDKANYDDIISDELHLVVNKPVELLVGSRDVIHDVGLPHFRMKIDAVPGLPTKLWFTPKYTTSEMRRMTNNPEFTYEIACDQMCGKGHYSMRAVIIVETQSEYDAWLMSKKPAYEAVQAEIENQTQVKKDSPKK